MRKRLLLTGLIGLSLVMTACGGRGSLSGKGKESLVVEEEVYLVKVKNLEIP